MTLSEVHRDSLIKSIQVDRANFEYIATAGTINGSLLVSIRKIMDEYAIYLLKDKVDAMTENTTELDKIIEEALSEAGDVSDARAIMKKVALEHSRGMSKSFLDFLTNKLD